MSDVAGIRRLPQLGRIYPQAGTWLFSSGAFCVSGVMAWSYVDENRNIVMGNGFAGPFDARAVVFDGDRAEFEIGGGRLVLHLPYVITHLGWMKDPVQALSSPQDTLKGCTGNDTYQE